MGPTTMILWSAPSLNRFEAADQLPHLFVSPSELFENVIRTELPLVLEYRVPFQNGSASDSQGLLLLEQESGENSLTEYKKRCRRPSECKNPLSTVIKNIIKTFLVFQNQWKFGLLLGSRCSSAYWLCPGTPPFIFLKNFSSSLETSWQRIILNSLKRKRKS